MNAPPSLSQRFLHALPPISDRLMVGLFILIIFVGGMLAGNMLTRTGHMQGRVTEPSPLAVLQHQIAVLEHRVGVLEQRQTP
jgi:hypothetical protein